MMGMPQNAVTAPNLTPVPGYQAPVAYQTNGHLTPAPGIPALAYGYQAASMYPGMPMQAGMQPGMGVTGPIPIAAPALPEDLQRREVMALKALVELLVQKGVISLDEYLARLKR